MDSSDADTPALEELYDEDILARIDAVTGRAAYTPAGHDGADGGDADGAEEEDASPVTPRYPVARRLGVGGAMLAGSMLGLGEVLEPDRARQHIIDFVPDTPNEDEQLVTFHLVPGDPRASRLVIRPWLLDAFRRRAADRHAG